MSWPKRRKKAAAGDKPKRYRGNPVQDEGGWEHIWYGESGWTMAIKAGAEWQQVKLAANGTAEHKANYWLAWNGERMAKSTDYGLLEKNRPELAARVIRCLANWSSFQRAMAP